MARLLQTIKERKEDRVSQACAILAMDKEQFQSNEDKRHLLSIAARSLDDAKVAKKWVSLLRAEESTRTIELLIYFLPSINLRTLKPINKLAKAVLSNFKTTPPETRATLIKVLFQLIKLKPEIAKKLIKFLKKQQHVELKEQLAKTLLLLNTIPPELVDMYVSLLTDLKEQQQLLLLRKLIVTNNLAEKIALKYLQPTTPASIKSLLLSYLHDRKILPIKELQTLLLKEGNEEIRNQILQIFYINTKNISQHLDFLGKYLQHEKESGIRSKVIHILYKNITMNTEMVLFYIDLLNTEKHVQNSLEIAMMLAPYLAQEPLEASIIKKTFLNFLENSKDTYRIELIQYICKQLSKHIIIDDALFERMLVIYQGATEPKIKQEILYAFCDSLKSDNRLLPIYIDAIKSPAPLIREYACFGILPLPLTQENIPYLLATMPLLLDNNIREILREMIALRIITIPDKNQELIGQLKHIAKNGLGKVKTICEQGYEKALQNQNLNKQAGQVGQVDWSLWENRIKIEKKVDYVFPDILIQYDDNPAMAKELLKTILIDSACADSLYSATHINQRDIVRFLIAKDQIDKNIALFCFDYLINHALNKEDNVFLVALNNYHDISILKESFWVFFEKNLFNHSSYLNVLLLRNVMCNAYQNDTLLAQEFANRLFSFTNANAAIPYLEFLFMSIDWQYTGQIIDKLLTRPQLVDKGIKNQFDNLVSQLGKEIPFDLDVTPGFAD